MSVTHLQGDVFDVLPTIRPGSIDCVVTSPPYWALRSYLPKDHPLKPLELGSEPTPQAFVENVVRYMRLVRECMADHATCWLNLGDSYSANGWECRRVNKVGTGSMPPDERKNKDSYGITAGNLCLIPQRVAIALQADDWLVRSVVIWRKPAPMPQSVRGWSWQRCRVKVRSIRVHDGYPHAKAPGNHSHNEVEWSPCPGCSKCASNGGYVLRRGKWRPTSSWEPILMLAKTPAYYCDGERVETPAKSATGATANARDVQGEFDLQTWSAEPLKHAHYAAYPTALVDWCLRAGTSAKGYCSTCGAPWARVLDGGAFIGDRNPKYADKTNYTDWSGAEWAKHHQENPTVTTGWRPTCTCEHNEPRPGRVLDPFGGSGRTAVAALRLGLDCTLVELNPDYVAIAEQQCS